MIAPGRTGLLAALAIAMVATTACERKPGRHLEPVPPNVDPVVFLDTFGVDVDYQAFLGSKLDAVSIDTSAPLQGTASLKVTVPDVGYSGGAFTARGARDLSGYDALTFYAKASKAVTLDVAGIGNDNTGTSKYEARRSAIPLTTSWERFVIPIPRASRLDRERGLFFLAEGPEGGEGFDMWFDEIRFEKLGTVTHIRPTMFTRTVSAFVGATVAPQGTRTVLAVDGTDVTVEHQPGYFDYFSSNPSAVAIQNNLIRVVGGGSAAVTAKLDTANVIGTLTVNALAPPATPAPTPTLPASSVISLFSNAYVNVPVDTWSAAWDIADLTDVQIAGNDTKAYTNMSYAGVEFTTPTIDATAMTHFHIDVWVSTSIFRVKLVDFGANGIFGGGDDREHELTFNAGSTPALTPGAWSSLDIPLANFTNLTTRGHLAQLVLSGAQTAFVDNVYFHN